MGHFGGPEWAKPPRHDGDENVARPVLRQYSSIAIRLEENGIEGYVCSGLVSVVALDVGLSGSSSQCHNLPVRDLNNDRIRPRVRKIHNRMQQSYITSVKPRAVRSDDEVHRPGGPERFVPTCSFEFLAIPARPYLTTSGFGIHDNNESSSSKCGADVCR